MSQMLDPTFYRSPAEAIAAPTEGLAYVAVFDPSGRAKDAMTGIDCDVDPSRAIRDVTTGSPTTAADIGTGAQRPQTLDP